MPESSKRIVNVNGRNRRPWALQSRENLLKAAIEEIAEVGFDKAKLVDIAKRAGMTAGSVYTWFENKEDLFRAALEQALAGQLQDNVSAVSQLPEFNADNWLSQIAALVPRNHENTGPTDAQRLLIESYYASWRNPDVAGKILPGLRDHVGTYVDIIRNAQQNGSIRADIDAYAFAMILAAVPLGMALTNLAGLQRVEDAAWMPIIMDLYELTRPK